MSEYQTDLGTFTREQLIAAWKHTYDVARDAFERQPKTYVYWPKVRCLVRRSPEKRILLVKRRVLVKRPRLVRRTPWSRITRHWIVWSG